MTIIAPPNPLRGLSGGDGEYLQQVIDGIDGPVVLVGHSYGGSVITAAGTADKVVGLVYISGFAPDEGENLTDLQSKFPAPGIIPYIVEHQSADGGNEFTLAPGGFHESFDMAETPLLGSAPGGAARSGRCWRPPTAVSTPASTGSATSAWAPRSPRSKAPPTSS